MKTRYFLVTLVLGLGLGLASALLWALGGQTLSAVAASNAEGANVPDALAAELHVCLSGCPYSSVQAAVDVAGHGDIIKVAAGTYTDVHVRPRNDITTTGVVTQMVYLTKTVSIEGGYTIDNFTHPIP